MKIGVYGSAAGALVPKVSEVARQLGGEIARRGHTIVTGACPGYPYDAVRGAKELEGKFVGFSPAFDIEDHVSEFNFPSDFRNELTFIDSWFELGGNKSARLKYRNILSVDYVDAGIIVGGQTGTMNEVTLLYDFGKNIGVLEESGGIADQLRLFFRTITKNRGSRVVYSDNPVEIIEELERLGSIQR